MKTEDWSSVCVCSTDAARAVIPPICCVTAVVAGCQELVARILLNEARAALSRSRCGDPIHSFAPL